jgi:iron complex outermembrane recepter protein
MTDCTKRLTDRHRNDQHRSLRGATRLMAAATLWGLASLVCAAEPANDVLHTEVTFNISAQPLGASLKQLASQAGVQILFEEQVVSGQQAPAVAARETPLQAISTLLKGTGLEFTAKDGTIVVRRKASGFTPTTSGQASGAVAGMSADAGQGPQNQIIELEAIIVTAQHRSEKLRDVPMGITALSGEYLDERQDRSFEDYVATVPGLSLNQASPGRNTLTLRGVNANSIGSTVSVYVDDSPVGSSSNLASGSTFASNFDPWDMQRIEVLRGPQGTLYGASSEGGLIKFVTNAPNTTAFSSLAEVGGNGIAQGGKGWSGKLMVNAPLGSGAAFRVSAYSESFPGYIDDPLLHQSDVNSVKRNGYRASLLLLPMSDLTVRLTAFRQEIKTDGNFFVDVDQDTRQPLFGPFTHERLTPEPNRFTYDHYNATVDWNLGWASALSSTSYGKNSNRQFLDASLTPAGPGTSLSQYFSEFVVHTPVGFSQTLQPEVQKLTQELRLQSPSNARLEWEVGGYFTREKAQFYQANNLFNLSDGSFYGGQPGAYLLINLDSLYREWAGFATLTYHINPKVDVQVGGRWAHNDQSFLEVDHFNLPPPSEATTPGAASAGKFLYSFAPRWHVTDDLMFYGRIASGYQPGGPNPLPAGVPTSVPSQYQPDSTVNYEVGVRNQLSNRRLSIDLTAFRIDWSKVQLATAVQTPVGPFNVTGNGGGAKSQGLEWALALTPIPDLTLSLTGAYINAKLTTDAPEVGGVSGERLPGSPDWSSSLDAEYGHSAFADYRAFIGGTWSYTGTEFTDFSATPTSFGPPTRLPGYTTLNLRTGLQNERWRFSLYAKNVTNKQAITSFTKFGVPGFPAWAVFNTPREIGGTVSFNFY